jgi:Protein of unknown function (DUF3048) N-terminal domain/Protein of unknown function (DUF3048) C-terminal domain
MKKRIFIALILLLAVGGCLAYALGWFDKDKKDEPHYSQLTGLEVGKDAAERPVLGIMVENSPEARPQTGLDSAGIVFETPTEGGITRYLALYQENMPEEVGPVRSLRVHFLDWLMGFDASVAHVGGNERSLELAESRDAKSLSQFKYSEPYYRDDTRHAPHNMYVRTDDLRDLQKELEHGKSSFLDIPHSDEAASQSPTATEITLPFSSKLYEVQFRYDPTGNSYARYLAGEPHTDNITKQAITVKNLVVLELEPDNDAQAGGLGSGRAFVFKNGEITEGRWQQSVFNQRIKITDNQGNEIPLNRGDTWYAALPNGRTPSY